MIGYFGNLVCCHLTSLIEVFNLIMTAHSVQYSKNRRGICEEHNMFSNMTASFGGNASGLSSGLRRLTSCLIFVMLVEDDDENAH